MSDNELVDWWEALKLGIGLFAIMALMIATVVIITAAFLAP